MDIAKKTLFRITAVLVILTFSFNQISFAFEKAHPASETDTLAAWLASDPDHQRAQDARKSVFGLASELKTRKDMIKAAQRQAAPAVPLNALPDYFDNDVSAPLADALADLGVLGYLRQETAGRHGIETGRIDIKTGQLAVLEIGTDGNVIFDARYIHDVENAVLPRNIIFGYRLENGEIAEFNLAKLILNGHLGCIATREDSGLEIRMAGGFLQNVARLWFDQAFCQANAARYDNDVLRQRLDWIFNDPSSLAQSLRSDYPAITESAGAIQEAIDLALYVNHEFFIEPAAKGILADPARSADPQFKAAGAVQKRRIAVDRLPNLDEGQIQETVQRKSRIGAALKEGFSENPQVIAFIDAYLTNINDHFAYYASDEELAGVIVAACDLLKKHREKRIELTILNPKNRKSKFLLVAADSRDDILTRLPSAIAESGGKTSDEPLSMGVNGTHVAFFVVDFKEGSSLDTDKIRDADARKAGNYNINELLRGFEIEEEPLELTLTGISNGIRHIAFGRLEHVLDKPDKSEDHIVYRKDSSEVKHRKRRREANMFSSRFNTAWNEFKEGHGDAVTESMEAAAQALRSVIAQTILQVDNEHHGNKILNDFIESGKFVNHPEMKPLADNMAFMDEFRRLFEQKWQERFVLIDERRMEEEIAHLWCMARMVAAVRYDWTLADMDTLFSIVAERGQTWDDRIPFVSILLKSSQDIEKMIREAGPGTAKRAYHTLLGYEELLKIKEQSEIAKRTLEEIPNDEEHQAQRKIPSSQVEAYEMFKNSFLPYLHRPFHIYYRDEDVEVKKEAAGRAITVLRSVLAKVARKGHVTEGLIRELQDGAEQIIGERGYAVSHVLHKLLYCDMHGDIKEKYGIQDGEIDHLFYQIAKELESAPVIEEKTLDGRIDDVILIGEPGKAVTQDDLIGERIEHPDWDVVGITDQVSGQDSHIMTTSAHGRIVCIGTRKLPIRFEDVKEAALNGPTAEVIINPTRITKARLRIEEERNEIMDYYTRKYSQDAAIIGQKTGNPSGKEIHFLADVRRAPGDPEEIKRLGAKGIGLFRLEALYDGETLPMKGEIKAEIERAFAASGGRLVVRAFDVGRKKKPRALGGRHDGDGANFYFEDSRGEKIFKDNLQAFLEVYLRASPKEREGMVFEIPMVYPAIIGSLFGLIDKVKEEAAEELGVSKRAFSKVAPGGMVELVVAAEGMEDMNVRFGSFAVGTSDFSSNVRGIEREGPEAQKFSGILDPRFLLYIKNVAEYVNGQKKPFYVCGEWAHDEKFMLYMALLRDIGLELDVVTEAEHIPYIKEFVRHIDIDKCRKIFSELLETGLGYFVSKNAAEEQEVTGRREELEKRLNADLDNEVLRINEEIRSSEDFVREVRNYRAQKLGTAGAVSITSAGAVRQKLATDTLDLFNPDKGGRPARFRGAADGELYELAVTNAPFGDPEIEGEAYYIKVRHVKSGNLAAYLYPLILTDDGRLLPGTLACAGEIDYHLLKEGLEAWQGMDQQPLFHQDAVEGYKEFLIQHVGDVDTALHLDAIGDDIDRSMLRQRERSRKIIETIYRTDKNFATWDSLCAIFEFLSVVTPPGTSLDAVFRGFAKEAEMVNASRGDSYETQWLDLVSRTERVEGSWSAGAIDQEQVEQLRRRPIRANRIGKPYEWKGNLLIDDEGRFVAERWHLPTQRENMAKVNGVIPVSRIVGKKPFFFKEINTRFPNVVYIGFNKRIEEPGARERWVEALKNLLILQNKLKDAFAEDMAEEMFNVWRAAYEAWAIQQMSQGWSDEDFMPEFGIFMKPDTDWQDILRGMVKNMRDIVRVHHRLDLRSGQVIRIPASLVTAIMGLSLHKHPVSGLDSKNKAWIIREVEGADGKRNVKLIEPQQTSDVTMRLADMLTFCVYNDGQIEMRRKITPAMIDKWVEDLEFKAVGLDEIVSLAHPVKEESDICRIESLVHDTQERLWPEEYFDVESIVFKQKGRVVLPRVGMGHHGYYELFASKGDIWIVSGKEEPTRLEEGKSVAIFENEIPGEIAIEAEEGAEVLRFYAPEEQWQKRAAVEETKKKILIINDDKMFAQFLTSAFKEAGFDAHYALDAKGAMHLMQHQDFDVVVSRAWMPQLAASDVIQMAKSKLASAKVAFTLTLSRGGEDKVLKEKGADAVFDISARGIGPNALLQEVEKLISEKNGDEGGEVEGGTAGAVRKPKKYRSYEEALEAFVKGKIHWGRTTESVRGRFLEELAAKLNSRFSMALTKSDLNVSDFYQPVEWEYDGIRADKGLSGLLVWAMRRYGCKHRKALDVLLKIKRVKDVMRKGKRVKSAVPVRKPRKYGSYGEALGAFVKGRIRWAKTTKPIRDKFLKELAAKMGYRGIRRLSLGDLAERVLWVCEGCEPVKKSLGGLLMWNMKRYKRWPTSALNKMVGIEKIGDGMTTRAQESPDGTASLPKDFLERVDKRLPDMRVDAPAGAVRNTVTREIKVGLERGLHMRPSATIYLTCNDIWRELDKKFGRAVEITLEFRSTFNEKKVIENPTGFDEIYAAEIGPGQPVKIGISGQFSKKTLKGIADIFVKLMTDTRFNDGCDGGEGLREEIDRDIEKVLSKEPGQSATDDAPAGAVDNSVLPEDTLVSKLRDALFVMDGQICRSKSGKVYRLRVAYAPIATSFLESRTEKGWVRTQNLIKMDLIDDETGTEAATLSLVPVNDKRVRAAHGHVGPAYRKEGLFSILGGITAGVSPTGTELEGAIANVETLLQFIKSRGVRDYIGRLEESERAEIERVIRLAEDKIAKHGTVGYKLNEDGITQVPGEAELTYGELQVLEEAIRKALDEGVKIDYETVSKTLISRAFGKIGSRGFRLLRFTGEISRRTDSPDENFTFSYIKFIAVKRKLSPMEFFAEIEVDEVAKADEQLNAFLSGIKDEPAGAVAVTKDEGRRTKDESAEIVKMINGKEVTKFGPGTPAYEAEQKALRVARAQALIAEFGDVVTALERPADAEIKSEVVPDILEQGVTELYAPQEMFKGDRLSEKKRKLRKLGVTLRLYSSLDDLAAMIKNPEKACVQLNLNDENKTQFETFIKNNPQLKAAKFLNFRIPDFAEMTQRETDSFIYRTFAIMILARAVNEENIDKPIGKLLKYLLHAYLAPGTDVDAFMQKLASDSVSTEAFLDNIAFIINHALSYRPIVTYEPEELDNIISILIAA